MVSVLAFYSDDRSSNPAIFSLINLRPKDSILAKCLNQLSF